MIEEMNFMQAAVPTISLTLTGLCAFAAKRILGKMDETASALAQHEKDDIGKYATVDQLVRVHERIDSVQSSMSVGFKETRDSLDTIRNILINGVHK